jgi:hypothetical protein
MFSNDNDIYLNKFNMKSLCIIETKIILNISWIFEVVN